MSNSQAKHIPHSFSLSEELIADMKYYYNTVEFSAESLSRIVENVMRQHIPSRKQSVTATTRQ